MHRIDADANVANLFSDGDTGTGQPGTKVDAAWLNAVQEEICNAILAKGLTLVKGTNTQLATALAAVTAAIPAAGGSWSADATSGQEPLAWKDGTGTVHLRGRIIGSGGLATAATIATLPAGYRPAAKRTGMLGGYSNVGAWLEAYGVEINADGTLVTRQLCANSTPAAAPVGSMFDLSGISFVAGG